MRDFDRKKVGALDRETSRVPQSEALDVAGRRHYKELSYISSSHSSLGHCFFESKNFTLIFAPLFPLIENCSFVLVVLDSDNFSWKLNPILRSIFL